MNFILELKLCSRYFLYRFGFRRQAPNRLDFICPLEHSIGLISNHTNKTLKQNKLHVQD